MNSGTKICAMIFPYLSGAGGIEAVSDELIAVVINIFY